MNLLEVKNLHTHFHTDRGLVPALNGVSFSIKKGEVLGIVGESGCGKSVTSLSILQLLGNKGKIEKGSIQFKGQELTTFTKKQMRKVRGDEISMIFQEPLTSLNPLIRVGKQIAETILLHRENYSKNQAKEHAIKMMKMVGIPQAEENIVNIHTSFQVECVNV